MSDSKRNIDYQSLEKELHQALRDDELYRLQNDAKLRAVEQRVPTYNHFREMVNGAHLKPLEQADINKKIPTPINSFACGTNNRSPNCTRNSTVEKTSRKFSDMRNNESGLNFSFNNTRDFMVEWRKLKDSASKVNFLSSTRHLFGNRIFCTEVPYEFFEQVIDFGSNLFSYEDSLLLTDIFIAMARCNRFVMNLRFLTNEKRELLKRMLERFILSKLDGSEELVKKYRSIWE